jgi:hypothetical protein
VCSGHASATTPVTHDVFGPTVRASPHLPRTGAGTVPAAVPGPSGRKSVRARRPVAASRSSWSSQASRCGSSMPSSDTNTPPMTVRAERVVHGTRRSVRATSTHARSQGRASDSLVGLIQAVDAHLLVPVNWLSPVASPSGTGAYRSTPTSAVSTPNIDAPGLRPVRSAAIVYSEFQLTFGADSVDAWQPQARRTESR